MVPSFGERAEYEVGSWEWVVCFVVAEADGCVDVDGEASCLCEVGSAFYECFGVDDGGVAVRVCAKGDAADFHVCLSDADDGGCTDGKKQVGEVCVKAVDLPLGGSCLYEVDLACCYLGLGDGECA